MPEKIYKEVVVVTTKGTRHYYGADGNAIFEALNKASKYNQPFTDPVMLFDKPIEVVYSLAQVVEYQKLYVIREGE